MPQINRIRVNNVKYNFGTQYYDDFLMRFSGKNTIYDLANGGGKSVLMLLLLQNMIPNCTLDEKQPVEKLFRTGSGSNTIHSMVEWLLSDVHQKNHYKYMLTGFCARKAREEETEDKDAAEIDYFNYVIFYREYNEHDIKNFPLTVDGKDGKKERITYRGLKNYLKELERKDFNLEVKIFDKKGDYQRFIAEYGIYESEWEMIRGINKTEGHVRTYFETNYKTTRKVVEDLLIEEIIEKSFKNRVLTTEGAKKQENRMVETLLEIKDKLLELSAKKSDIQQYDAQVELLEGFKQQADYMKELYSGQEMIDRELASCYHALKKIRQQEEEKKQEYQRELQALDEQKINLHRDCEAARIQENERKAEEVGEILEDLQCKEEKGEEEQKKYRDMLLRAESMNDYLDYLYYKRERDVVKESVSRSSQDKGELKRELEELAGERKKRDEKWFAEWQEKLTQAGEQTEREEQLLKELEEQEKELSQTYAVAEYKMTDSGNKREICNETISRLKQEQGLVMLYDPEQELRNCKEQQRELEENRNRNSIQLISIANRKRELEGEVEQLRRELENCMEQRQQLEAEREQLASYEERVKKLKAVYLENDTEQLYHLLSGKYQEICDREKNLEEERVSFTTYVQGLRTGCPVGGTQEVKTVLKYLNRIDENQAVSGEELLRRASVEERKLLLERIPMLPFAVVVKDFAVVAADTGLSRLNLGNCAVPVIAWEMVENKEYLDFGELTYAMCRKELFFDEQAITMEIGKVENEIDEISKELDYIREQKGDYERDCNFLREFLESHFQRIRELETETEQLLQKQGKMENHLEMKQEEQKRQRQQEEARVQEQEQLEKEQKSCDEKLKILEEICHLILRSEELEQDYREVQNQKKNTSAELSNIKGRMDAWSGKVRENRRMLEQIEKSMRERKQQWEKYRAYYQESIEVHGYETLQDEEIDSRFLGILEVFRSGSGHMEDKQKLLDNYETAMEKSLQAIDYKGIRVAELEKHHEQGMLKETGKEELLQYKQKMEEQGELLKGLKKEIRAVHSEKDRLEGAVMNGREVMIQKYGEFREVKLNGISAEEFVSQREQQMQSLMNREAEVRTWMDDLDKKGRQQDLFLHDMDKILTEEMRQWQETEPVLYEDIYAQVEKTMESFVRFQKSVQEKRENYEDAKHRLIDALRKLGSEPLAEEIADHVRIPENIGETEQQMTALTEIEDCLKLEKERIEKSIRDMELIKENFESQCIQSCVNIKSELEKLPKLSRIMMDGESIPVISLSIPYVKEEEYEARMAEYIDRTVYQADAIKSREERVKFLKNQLSWKRLFAVIVRDMNGIRLNLYKRERIREQSRYLKYEEAVGSTGQSQGIYIQFFIAMINYISSLYSREEDSTSLGKVIFIDNPFGAAKDIYIWEPIFEMLKTNNVQLIVPCRGATPAITGRFDVNYVLGQKMVDGKQQTVVVDYYSNVDSEALEYTVLSYEQETLENFL